MPIQTDPLKALQFAYPTDDLASLFTPTLISGVQDAMYPVANIGDDNPAKPYKVSTATFRLLWDFGSAKTVKLVGLINANFQSGLGGVTFAMGSSTATTGFSRDFTIGSYGEDGYPPNPYLDLTDINPSYRYASLEASSANIVAVAIGRFIISQEIRNLRGFVVPQQPVDTEDHPITENSTDAGVVTIFSLGVRRRWFNGVMVEDDSNTRILQSWRRSAQGRSVPFPLLPHRLDDDIWYARFMNSKIARTIINQGGQATIPEGFEEVSRGLKPTPSAV